MPSQSDERSCGRETDHNGSRWWKRQSWWWFGGLDEQREDRRRVYGGMTEVEENITEADDAQTDRHTDRH